MQAGSKRWLIGDFEFDESTYLWQGTQQIKLGKYERELLAFLIDTFDKRPRPTNEKIKVAVWKRSKVDDGSLHTAASLLRKALGGKDAGYIGTKPYYHLTKKPMEIHGSFGAATNWLLEKTYYAYQKTHCPLLAAPELVSYLEKRHRCVALRLGKMAIPATVIWSNVRKVLHPDQILGSFDFADPSPLKSSSTLSTSEYAMARDFIKEQFQSGKIKYEGCDYRMTNIDLTSTIPKIHGAFGLYYDNILTQYAIEWELKKALLAGHSSKFDVLLKPGALPLRESIEACGDPLLTGAGRCAAITVSALLIFKRPAGHFACLIRRRSMDVGVSPGMLHVVPAGMFEASNTSDPWSVETSIWRELLEEVYNDEELLGAEHSEILDYILGREPVKLLRTLLKKGSAEFSVTGIVCDLLNLRPEICTVLYVDDPGFSVVRRMQVNWEYEPERRTGKFLVNWDRIDNVIENDGAKYGIVASGAGCIALGREWAKNRHGI